MSNTLVVGQVAPEVDVIQQAVYNGADLVLLQELKDVDGLQKLAQVAIEEGTQLVISSNDLKQMPKEGVWGFYCDCLSSDLIELIAKTELKAIVDSTAGNEGELDPSCVFYGTDQPSEFSPRSAYWVKDASKPQAVALQSAAAMVPVAMIVTDNVRSTWRVTSMIDAIAKAK